MIAQRKLSPERQARRFHLKKRWNKAIEEYQKCLSEDEKNLAVANLLGDALYQLKNVDEAFETYRKVLSSYEGEGLYDNAIAIAKKMSRLDPQNSGIQLKLAELYTDQEFLADALTHLRNYVQFVGKRIDEKATLGLFQKISRMTIQNPSLWDQIAEFYYSLKIDDPDLNKIMAPGNAAARVAKSTTDDDVGGTARRARSIDALEATSGADQDAHQPGLMELDILPHDSKEGAEADDKSTDQLILQMMDTIRKKKGAKPKVEKEEAPEDDFKFSNILSEVLPPEEQPKEPGAPTRSSKGTSKVSSPRPQGITLDEVDSLDTLDSDDKSFAEPASNEQTDREEKKFSEAETTDIDLTSPGILDERVTTSELISDHIDMEADGQQSADEDEKSLLEPEVLSTGKETADDTATEPEESEMTQPPKPTEVRGSKHAKARTKKAESDVEEAVLWTLPYEVAEESAPESPAKEELSEEESGEAHAVESILTGFSGDASDAGAQAESADLTEEALESGGEDETTSEEQPPAARELAQTLDAETQEDRSVSDEETTELHAPEAGSEVSDESEEATTGEEVDQDLQSMELSKIAEINSQKRVVTVSFDGKEHFDMGKIYKEMKLWDAAIAEFKTAATDPNWRAKSCIVLSECYREKGDVTLAITQLKWALSTADELKVENDKYDLHFELGLIYEKAGNLNDAKEEFQAVHRWNPAHNGVEKKLMELRKRLQKA